MTQVVIDCDPLMNLTGAQTFNDRLAIVHGELRRCAPGVERMAVAAYDRQSGRLNTLVASPAEESPLRNYEAVLADARSLAAVAACRQSRVVHDLSAFAPERQHTRRLLGHGYASSYTLPVYDGEALAGFVFCDSMHKGYFRNHLLDQARIFSQLVARLFLEERSVIRALDAALRTALGMVHVRDPETGNHLERVARYTRLIARELVARGKCAMDDEQIAQLFYFAPLHDIGKVGIPDEILRKPGKLLGNERTVMDQHPLIGRQMVDSLVRNFGFQHIPYIDMLSSLVELHHESLDGSGYPHGLQGDAIPLAARIIAVGDVFDALTTIRTYKEPWPNPHAIAMLQLLAIDRLDADCVAVLIDCQEQVAQIQRQFADNELAA